MAKKNATFLIFKPNYANVINTETKLKSEQEALKEAKDSSSFDTPFIVSAREFCVRKKSPYSEVWIVLPFYDKGTLWDHFQRLKKTGKIFSEGEILHLFRGIVAGVAEIHKSGQGSGNKKNISHRIILSDLKQTCILEPNFRLCS